VGLAPRQPPPPSTIRNRTRSLPYTGRQPIKKGEKGLKPVYFVYFYKPHEIARRGRKAKHLSHYHGPAIVQEQVEDREHQYHIMYDGKPFKRGIRMLIPERTMLTIDVIRHDPTVDTSPHAGPALHKPGVTLREEELVLCKTEADDKTWYLAEIHKIYPDEIEVIYHTTPLQQLDDYESVTQEQRQERLSQCRFRKTWFIRSGTNTGKGTISPPFPKNPQLRFWTGKLPTSENLILANGIELNAIGYLTKESTKIASRVLIPHEALNTVEDEQEILEQLRCSNAMYAYAEATTCSCNRCRRIWSETANEVSDIERTTALVHLPGSL
jgi:hypothetical protein